MSSRRAHPGAASVLDRGHVRLEFQPPIASHRAPCSNGRNARSSRRRYGSICAAGTRVETMQRRPRSDVVQSRRHQSRLAHAGGRARGDPCLNFLTRWLSPLGQGPDWRARICRHAPAARDSLLQAPRLRRCASSQRSASATARAMSWSSALARVFVNARGSQCGAASASQSSAFLPKPAIGSSTSRTARFIIR